MPGFGRCGTVVQRAQLQQQPAAVCWPASLDGPRKCPKHLQHRALIRELCFWSHQVLSHDIDLLHPPVELEKQKNKRKRLVQSPNSFFMDVKCQGCFQM